MIEKLTRGDSFPSTRKDKNLVERRFLKLEITLFRGMGKDSKI